MSTATAIPLHNGAGTTDRARTIVSESLASMASSSPLAAAKTLYSGARTWVSATLSRLGLGRSYSWARGYVAPALSWSRGLVATAGIGNVTAYGLTTHRGRSWIFHVIPGTAYNTVKTGIRLLLQLPRNLLCKFSFGRRAVGYVLASIALAEAFVSDLVTVAETWIADRHNSQAMRWARSVLWFSMTSRVIRRFVPVGWLRGALQLLMLFVPTTTITERDSSYTDTTDVVRSTTNDSAVATVIDSVLILAGDKETIKAVDPVGDEGQVFRAADVAAAQATAAAQPTAPAASNREQRRHPDNKARDRAAANQRRSGNGQHTSTDK